MQHSFGYEKSINQNFFCFLSIDTRQIIQKALESLKHVDEILGNDGPLTRIIKCGVEGDLGNGGLHGSIYEIQEALEIEKTGLNSVKRFNVTEEFLKEKLGQEAFKSAGGCKIEFDIMTEDTLIECKNIDGKVFLRKANLLNLCWIIKRLPKN